MNKRTILPVLTIGVASLALAACDMGYQPGGYANQAYATGYGPVATPIYESGYPAPQPVYGGPALNVVVPLGHDHSYYHGGDFHRGPPSAAYRHGNSYGGGRSHDGGHHDGGGYHPQHTGAPSGHGGGHGGGGHGPAPAGHGGPPPSGGGHDRDHGQH